MSDFISIVSALVAGGLISVIITIITGVYFNKKSNIEAAIVYFDYISTRLKDLARKSDSLYLDIIKPAFRVKLTHEHNKHNFEHAVEFLQKAQSPTIKNFAIESSVMNYEIFKYVSSSFEHYLVRNEVIAEWVMEVFKLESHYNNILMIITENTKKIEGYSPRGLNTSFSEAEEAAIIDLAYGVYTLQYAKELMPRIEAIKKCVVTAQLATQKLRSELYKHYCKFYHYKNILHGVFCAEDNCSCQQSIK